ncbi:hypothetical protein ACETRY_00395 [Cronobacter malonaticus]|uniref:hypothetical protein n=1 Tax=Cronobacter malonaticus TaxID=413503 RepID=UPI00029C7B68|nr:hypothetical protein [Cronobacter malonaticus]CCK00289.1 hypothetical protein BN130_3046 [Cronobacter malonaticus 507]
MHTLAAYGRDRLHREVSRSQGVLSQETRYDPVGRVMQRTVLDARRELVSERRYRWDRTDQIVQQIHTDTAPATSGEKYSQYLWATTLRATALRRTATRYGTTCCCASINLNA